MWIRWIRIRIRWIRIRIRIRNTGFRGKCSDPTYTQMPFLLAIYTISQFILFTGPKEGTAGEKEVYTWGLDTLPGGLEAPSWGPEAPTAPPPKRLASPSSEFYRMDLLARLCS
jgi:hypothetical protein